MCHDIEKDEKGVCVIEETIDFAETKHVLSWLKVRQVDVMRINRKVTGLDLEAKLRMGLKVLKITIVA